MFEGHANMLGPLVRLLSALPAIGWETTDTMILKVKSQTTRSNEEPVGRGLTVSSEALVTAGSDREFRQLVHNMLAFAARIQEIRNRFGQFIGISGTQYTILISVSHLEKSEGGVGVNQIADHLHLSGAFVTIEVHKLVSAKLIKKCTNPDDKRRVLLTVTGRARKLLDDLLEIQQPTNDTLFSSLSKKDFEGLYHTMGNLVNSGDRALRLLDYMASDK